MGRVIIKSQVPRIFPEYYMSVVPGYFYQKIEEKYNQKKSLAVWLIPWLLVVFTRQLEILVTTLGGGWVFQMTGA